MTFKSTWVLFPSNLPADLRLYHVFKDPQDTLDHCFITPSANISTGCHMTAFSKLCIEIPLGCKKKKKKKKKTNKQQRKNISCFSYYDIRSQTANSRRKRRFYTPRRRMLHALFKTIPLSFSRRKI